MTTWKDDRSNPEPKKRPVPQMPEGYYSGDKPNPHLREFVEKNMTPYDPDNDCYDVPPFERQINVGNRRSPINDLHIYWSKKPYEAIRQYIRHYTKPDDIVLDPFCGSGGTALVALMEGRKAIAIDRSPAATFITKNYCTPVDVAELQAAFEELKKRVMPEIDWLYETRCDRCGGKATTAYTVYSQRFRCPRCLETVALFDCPEVEGRTLKGKPKKIRVCPHCQKGGHQEQIKSTGEHLGAVPVLVSYICENGCKPARDERRHDDADPKKREYFERYDLGKIKEIENKFEDKEMRHWYPEADLAKAIPYRMLYKKDFRPVDASKLTDLFTTRNLWALAAMLDAIEKVEKFHSISEALRFAVSGALFNATKMYKQRDKGGGPQEGTYYLPQIFREVRGWTLFDQKISNMIRAEEVISNVAAFPEKDVCISTQSVLDLKEIQNNSVNYIFTDPPYAGNIQYGELNFVWEAWLGFDTNWHDEEIIVNEIRGKT